MPLLSISQTYFIVKGPGKFSTEEKYSLTNTLFQRLIPRVLIKVVTMDQLSLTQMIGGGVSGKDLGLWCLLGTCIRIRISEMLFDPCGILISEPC